MASKKPSSNNLLSYFTTNKKARTDSYEHNEADFGCGSKDEKTLASPNNDIGFIVDKVVLTDADKKLVSYLRNSMKETRLNGLAMLSCHREVEITTDEVIDELCLKNRKLEFIL